MSTTIRRFLALSALASLAVACGDASTNNNTTDSGIVGEIDIARPDVVSGDAAADAGRSDAGPADVGAVDAGPADVGAIDAGPADVGVVDSGVVDSGAVDSGRVDSGALDSGTPDSGATDSGATDSGATDSGAVDSGRVDSGATDAGAGDAGSTGATATLWVLRLGTGSASVTNAATAAFIDRRRASDGASAGDTIALPVAAAGAQNPITLSGTATSEGSLTRSADGRFVSLAGYAAEPGLASVAGTASSATPRVVARINAAGMVDTSTLLRAAFSANNVRGAVTVDGSAFYVAGTASPGGIYRVDFGNTMNAVQVISTPGNVRTVGVFNGQLYGAASTTNFYGIFRGGEGLPTTENATAALLPGFSSTSGPSPYGFALLDRDPAVAGVDTAYVADDRAIASGGGVQRWTLANNTWSLGATFSTGITSGVRGVTAWVENSVVYVAAVTAESPSRLVLFRDVQGQTPGAAVALATAATNTVFRGVALAPSN
ncbi:MAG: hypothetical protein JNK72_16545 [Myxococcales bacterium]|nr:hypothetical protein [Myxococcales bacterium]